MLLNSDMELSPLPAFFQPLCARISGFFLALSPAVANRVKISVETNVSGTCLVVRSAKESVMNDANDTFFRCHHEVHSDHEEEW